MKYIVNFTLPVTCSCIVEAENAVEAGKIVNNKKYGDIKHLEFSVDDDDHYDDDVCDLINVDEYEE